MSAAAAAILCSQRLYNISANVNASTALWCHSAVTHAPPNNDHFLYSSAALVAYTAARSPFNVCFARNGTGTVYSHKNIWALDVQHKVRRYQRLAS